MVYMDPNELGWRPYVKSWMQRTCTKMKDETKVFISRFLRVDLPSSSINKSTSSIRFSV